MQDLDPSTKSLLHEPTGRWATWGLPLVFGCALIAGGAIALAASLLTSLVTIVSLGIALVVVGCLDIIAASRISRERQLFVYLLAGLLSIVVGGLFLYEPIASLASVTLLIGAYFFASGLVRGVTSLSARYRAWGWDLAYAALALALGTVVTIAWPYSSVWVLGTLIAAEIISRGLLLAFAAWRARALLAATSHATA